METKQKINKTHVYILLLMFVLTNIIYGVIIYNLKINCKIHKTNAIAVVKGKESTINNMVKSLNLTYTNSNFKINREVTLIAENNIQIPLSRIKIDDYLLVFRFDEFTCMDCVYKELGNIDSLANKIGSKRILILASYDNKRDLFLNKRLNNIKLPVYNVPLKSFDNSIENFSIPYLFILDSSYKVHNLFIPNKYYPDISENYFKSIVELIQNK